MIDPIGDDDATDEETIAAYMALGMEGEEARLMTDVLRGRVPGEW